MLTDAELAAIQERQATRAAMRALKRDSGYHEQPGGSPNYYGPDDNTVYCRHAEISRCPACWFKINDTADEDVAALLAEVKLLRSRPITDPHYNAIYDPED